MTQSTIVQCPSCATRFIAPMENFLPHGRQVRCSSCRHQWFHNPAKSGTAEGQVHNGRSRTKPAAMMSQPKSVGPLKSRPVFDRILFWAFSLCLLAGVIGFALRKPIAANFEASVPIYEELDKRYATGKGNVMRFLGSDRGGSQLVAEKLEYRINDQDGARKLMLSTSLHNSGGEPVEAPKLEITVKSPDGSILASKTMGREGVLKAAFSADERRDLSVELPVKEGKVDTVQVQFVR